MLEVRRLGSVPYASALEIQQALVTQRQSGEIPDVLLLCEHPHVITLGVRTRSRLDNVLVASSQLAAHGVALYEAPRGGDVTYHGPGQIVGYPILDLRPDRCDVHRYVRDLEEVLIRSVGRFGIRAGRAPGLTGVWVDRDKLAAIGVRISRWVTSHGFALNVSTDLAYFDLIRPCGLRGRGVTSLDRLTAAPVRLSAVQDALTAEFGAVFGREVHPDSTATGTAACSQADPPARPATRQDAG